MENSRSGKTIAVVALVVAVLCLSVGFATISATLTINGTAEITGSKDTLWKVQFENLGPNTQAAGGKDYPVAGIVGKAEEVVKPTITNSGIEISTFQVNLVQPGDEIYYEFQIHNAGELDAKIAEVALGEIGCSATEEGKNADKVCANLEYTLTYKTGEAEKNQLSTNELTGGSALTKSDLLKAGTTVTAELRLKYKTTIDATELPDKDVTVTIDSTTVLYQQAATVKD